MTSGGGDTGVSNERTALAWQRTALSILASAAIMARLTWGELGVVGSVPLLVAMVLSTWVFWESRWRYGHHAGTRLRSRPRSGRAPFTLTAAIALMAATELLALVAT